MEKKELIACLKANKRLKEREEVLAFDDSLEKLAEMELDKAELIELFMILEENSEQEEVMWGLIHLIEDSANLPTFFQAFIEVIPRLIDKAPDWAKLFHFRILNSQKSRSLLKEMLPIAKPASQKAIRKILDNISSNESPPLSTHANFVLSK